jgi:4,5-dihydroxyphthalate decarboxylase
VPAKPLKTVLGDHGQTKALKSGAVPVAGYELDFVAVKPMQDAYRRMARTAEFDICELAPTTYLAAKAAGMPFTALPIPMTRRFRHSGLLVPVDSPIREPKDLEGRRVGVRAHTVTAGAWTRGVYTNEYGLDVSKVTWVVDDEEHVLGMQLPPNVVQAPDGKKLSQLIVEGGIDAGFTGAAGIGDDPGIELRDLFPNPAELEADWFRRTGIYPIHGVIAVRDDVLAANPDLPKALLDAFTEAKRIYLDQIKSGEDTSAEAKRYARLSEVVGDPLPYGYEANRPSLDALVLYAKQQGFLPSDATAEAYFLHL